MVKKIAIAIWILTASFLGILVVNYVGNRKMIENYGQGVYQQNELGFLGFTQPYINHFNKGNVFYQLGDYQKAKQEYQLALNLRPDEPYDCKIRVNYALSYVTPIDVEDINELLRSVRQPKASSQRTTALQRTTTDTTMQLRNSITRSISLLRI